MKPMITYRMVMAAAQDAGNRSMRQNGRKSWNEDDWNCSAYEFHRLSQPHMENVFNGGSGMEHQERADG